MKRIDRYIIRSFTGPFFLTFFITLFILLMQFLWKYIDDLVGKGLEWYVVAELMFYASATMVPLALPLATLLAALMTFGNLGERFELAAFKSSGISMFRFMRAAIVFSGAITLSAWGFANYVMPQASLKFWTKMIDVSRKKPALNIKPNVFYHDIENYSILITDKADDNINVDDITIYNKTDRQGFHDVLVAESAQMFADEGQNLLVMRLFNGRQYQALKESQRGREPDEESTKDHMRMEFGEWEKALDLSGLDLGETDEELYEKHYRMLSQGQLAEGIDSIKRHVYQRMTTLEKSTSNHFWFERDSLAWARMRGELPLVGNARKAEQADSTDTEARELDDRMLAALVQSEQTTGNAADTPTRLRTERPQSAKALPGKMDTATWLNITGNLANLEPGDEFVEVMEPTDAKKAIARALVATRNIKSFARQIEQNAVHAETRIVKYRIEWHRKMILAAACFVFLFVGAPLGAIIRKGGFGMPVLVSVLIFVIFYVLYITGEKAADGQVWSVLFGMWFSIIVIFPFAMWLTMKAKNDSALFNASELQLRFRKLFRRSKADAKAPAA